MEKPKIIRIGFHIEYPIEQKDLALKKYNELKGVFDAVDKGQPCVIYGGSWEIKQQYIGYPNDVCTFCEREFNQADSTQQNNQKCEGQ